MTLTCPTCKQTFFQTLRLPAGPDADMCITCRGAWISSERYFNFLANGPGESLEEAADPPTTPPAQPDSPALKLCPACGKFMRWYDIGHGVPFGVDRCSTCGGMWLNAGEWAALRTHNLHIKLHFVASDVWQADLAKEKRLAADAKDLERRLGAPDFAELRRIADWLAAHPHRDEMAAFIRDRLRGER